MKTPPVSLLRRVLGVAGVLLAFAPFQSSLSQSCGDVKDRGAYCPGEDRQRWEPGWTEEAVVLPPPPLAENLLALEANQADSRYEYLLDRTSIARGKDGVMRYVVVVTSATGARNALFEGIRCETDEVRTYAYAGSNGTFSRSTGSRWRPLAGRGVRGYQEYLAAVILCDKNGYAWEAEDAAAALAGQYTSGGVRIRSFCRDCMDNMDERRND